MNSRNRNLDSLAIRFGVTCVATSLFEMLVFKLDFELDFDIVGCDGPN